MSRAWILVVILTLPAIGHATPADEALSLGRTCTDDFFRDDMAPLWSNMTQQMREVLVSEDGLRQFRRRVDREVGAETEILNERIEHMQGFRTYTRLSTFDGFDRPIVISWSFDADDRIAGFFVRPQQEPARSPYVDYDTKADLRLPFQGEWFVFWGGRSVAQNYHAAVADQRFAYDLLIFRDNKSHRGDGKRNDQYYCWGRPVLAPADGIVVEVVSELPDNPPGVMDPGNPPGNYVVLDLGNREYALLAHLQQDSIEVSKGQQVLSGQQLGRCGNSGNTTEPHLHFHLQDDRRFGRGNGKPAFFNNYLSNGSPVTRGEPVRGEFISPDP